MTMIALVLAKASRDTGRAMSQENVERARRTYAALNEAYRSGDVNDLLPIAEEMWDPAIVLRTADTFVESGEWRGYEGVLQFTSEQMQAFEQMWDRARGVHRFWRRPGSAGSLRRAGAAHRDRG